MLSASNRNAVPAVQRLHEAMITAAAFSLLTILVSGRSH